MESLTDKKVMAKIKKNWHHDIQYIDGRFVEDVVKQFQETNDEDLLNKILDNYAIFKNVWAKAFAQYLDGDLEAGLLMHDEIVWRSAFKFNRAKSRKPDGKAFNAYVVSALLNQLKNQRNAKMSHKNHPRVLCPICNEEVYQIDHKHLKHSVDLDRYRKMFPNYPLVSTDGRTHCPITGDRVAAVTEPYLNRLNKSYTVAHFMAEYHSILPKMPVVCPVSGSELSEVSNAYPAQIMPGYTPEAFLEDFPNFAGAFSCPFSGKKLLEMTQEHLNSVLGQDGSVGARTLAQVAESFPNFTDQVRQVSVVNPYTNKRVPEITLAMLAAAGTSWKEHMEKHAEVWLEKYYPGMVTCPFTGRKTHVIKKSDLAEIGKTPWDFYAAVSKYPLKKFQVKCGLCGEWVDNVWAHLEEKQHSYAQSMTVNEFESMYGTYATKVVIRTNSYVQNDSGDSIHVADLFPEQVEKVDFLEIEDSLLEASQDDLDRQIAKSIRGSSTVEDIFFSSAEIKVVNVPFEFKSGMTKAVRDAVRDGMSVTDFDLAKPPVEGSSEVTIMVPSRDTIRRRLARMIEASDLAKTP